MLSHVLMEIRKGVFEPDASRSGRLRADAIPLDRVNFFSQCVEPPIQVDGSEPESKFDGDRSEVDDKASKSQKKLRQQTLMQMAMSPLIRVILREERQPGPRSLVTIQ